MLFSLREDITYSSIKRHTLESVCLSRKRQVTVVRNQLQILIQKVSLLNFIFNS